MSRIIGLLIAAITLTVFAYLSRFWTFSWWGRDGLFGIEALRPAGDLWRRWMNMIDLGPYDILLWAVAGFAMLTILQRLWDKLSPH